MESQKSKPKSIKHKNGAIVYNDGKCTAAAILEIRKALASPHIAPDKCLLLIDAMTILENVLEMDGYTLKQHRERTVIDYHLVSKETGSPVLTIKGR